MSNNKYTLRIKNQRGDKFGWIGNRSGFRMSWGVNMIKINYWKFSKTYKNGLRGRK